MSKVLRKKYDIIYDKNFIKQLRNIQIYFIKKLKEHYIADRVIENIMKKIKLLIYNQKLYYNL